METSDRARPSTSTGRGRPGAAWHPGSRLAALAVVGAVVALTVTGCVGTRGRNDDPVAPGSDGRPRLEIPVRIDDDPAGARP